MITNAYENIYQKLLLECKCGQQFLVNFNDFRTGKQQCNDCGRKRIANSRKNSYEKVKYYIEVESKSGCKLLSTEYVKNSLPIDIQCNCGNIFSTTYATFTRKNSSQSCELCANKIKWNKDKIINYCLNNCDGYVILDVFRRYEEKSNNLYVYLKCPNINHEPYAVSWNNFYSRGDRCHRCFYDNNTGDNHPLWCGGVTPLYNYVRNNLHQWKKDSVSNSDNKCILTGKCFQAIHHLYAFNLILKETLNELNLPIFQVISDYSDEELKNIIQKCLEIHYRYPLGVCLTNEVHNLFHSVYGNNNNTPDQFYEFKQRYLSGEFDLKEASNL